MADFSGSEEALELLRRLADIEEIKQLKHRYWRLMDQGLRDELPSVMTEDIVCDYGPYGQLVGREAILKFFDEQVFPQFELMIHTGHNPEVTVDGDSAIGLWTYDSYQLVVTPEHIASWHGGFYEDRYRRVRGTWLIAYMHGEHAFNYVTDSLWAADRQPWPPETSS